MKIALYARSVEPRWLDRLELIINNLAEKNAELIYYVGFWNKLQEEYKIDVPAGSLFTNADDIPEGTDLLLCLGGDGTLLESLPLIKKRAIPVAGVNFGRLGFLAGADLGPATEWIDDLFAKKYFVEKRMLFNIEGDFLDSDFYPYSLNEIAIQRRDPLMVAVNVKIDGKELPTYWSDGLVIASPTGSTAYSLSIGGPIMLPGVKAMIIAPIAPHNLNIRPLVVPETSEIELSVVAKVSPAILSLDNRSVTIPNNAVVKIKKASYELNYISFKENQFINGLREKLLWGEDKRNL
jgi:NAD+ kinase